ncbi:peptide-methionine (S)-S-oxide reductase MsrA [uncultured Desulfovibrio sp.]|uniref:peptide-methionine (S)-S-oxide reductase MsrA n=1 Tax=uncultured Desulfovibrio sp. TaxID=167968 RepID=UPI0025E34788|nr:peptide-methionine (S)-S-oxide reductase MsrA [uncultured Desulfovibrio sp.]
MAGGCFWGVEDAFEKLPGAKEAVSGYTGGTMSSPSYEQVSTGRTGHAEAVLIRYDPSKFSYEQILRRFFEIHDPTQLDRQGPDVGSQYRSAIFYASGSEKHIAEHLIDELKAGLQGGDATGKGGPLP